MPRTDGLVSEVAVIGAGAFGLTTALRLARAGLHVRVIARCNSAPNASAVAAGMVAPVSETLAEDGDGEHLRRLLSARDLWPEFASEVPGLVLHHSRTRLLCSDEAARHCIITPLSGWGVDFSLLSSPQLDVEIGDDWRLDAPEALKALRGALAALGVAIEPGVVNASPRGDLLSDGRPLQATHVVIAGGYESRLLTPAAPELACLAPIKGQLVVFAGEATGPTLRGEQLYVVPQSSGARAGATMQPGLADVAVDADVVERMRADAVALSPNLAGAPYRGEAGVRAATPDGWPLVGPSITPGVFVATGARRNGWLLAPLASRIIADVITGAEPHPLAGAFHPGRFTR